MFTRICSVCGSTVAHTRRDNCDSAIKRNAPCIPCAAKLRRSYKGKNNPFFGKIHTIETKAKIAKGDKSFSQTKSFKQKMSAVTSGKNNPMYGRCNYEIWVSKYGRETADRLNEEVKKKLSQAFSGENNPMFGKPTPAGAGNGWKGWYKGWFFRSLKELSYMINHIEKSGWVWQSAESSSLKIPYIDWKGTSRTYIPDFIINETTLVEVKPTKLHSCRTVRDKTEAAIKFCSERGWIFKVEDPTPLTDSEINSLHQRGLIKFQGRYEELYQERYNRDHD